MFSQHKLNIYTDISIWHGYLWKYKHTLCYQLIVPASLASSTLLVVSNEEYINVHSNQSMFYLMTLIQITLPVLFKMTSSMLSCIIKSLDQHHGFPELYRYEDRRSIKPHTSDNGSHNNHDYVKPSYIRHIQSSVSLATTSAVFHRKQECFVTILFTLQASCFQSRH